MHEQFHPLCMALNQLWASLSIAGVKKMPRLVFDEADSWIAATAVLPPEILLGGNGYMIGGFKFDLPGKPVREADRFVAQEIGA